MTDLRKITYRTGQSDCEALKATGAELFLQIHNKWASRMVCLSSPKFPP